MEASLLITIEKYLSPLISSSAWKIKSALFIGFLSIMLASPRIHMMNEYVNSDTGLWTVIIRKSNHLTDPLKDLPQSSHAAKKKLRLTVPIIAKCLNLNAWTIYLLQVILGFFSIFFFLSVIYPISNDKLLAFLSTASFAFIFAGKCAFIDIAGHLDAWPFFFALLALFTRFRLLQLICCLAIIWSDERGYILSGLTVFTLFIIENFNATVKNEKSKVNYWAFISLSAIPISIGIRNYLTSNYNLGTNYLDPANDVGLDLFFTQIEQRFFISSLIQFEGFWILFFTAIAVLLRHKKYILTALFAGFLLVNTLSSFIVGDIIRSASYGFPLIFIAYLIIKKLEPSWIYSTVLLVFIISFIIPPFQYLGENISYYSPFPFYYVFYFRNLLPF